MSEATTYYKPKRRVNPKTKKVTYQARYKSPLTGAWTMAKPAWNNGSATFAVRKDATRAIKEATDNDLRTAAGGGARSITVAEYFKVWQVDHPRTRRTQMGYNSKLRVAFRAEIDGKPLGDWEMRQLRRHHGREFIAHSFTERQRNYNGTQAVRRALSAFFADAIDDDYAEINPFDRLKVSSTDLRIVKPDREPRVWPLDDLHEFATFAPSEDAEAQYRTMIDGGLRLGETLCLQTELCSPDLLRVFGTGHEGKLVPSSSRKNHDRFVPMSEWLEAWMRSRVRRIDTPWMFPTITGKMWRENNWRRTIHTTTIQAANRDRKGARLDPRPHEMRHSWVTHMRAAGIDPADLADIAGHGIHVATKVYTHALAQSGDAVRKVVSK